MSNWGGGEFKWMLAQESELGNSSKQITSRDCNKYEIHNYKLNKSVRKLIGKLIRFRNEKKRVVQQGEFPYFNVAPLFFRVERNEIV